MSAIDEVKAKMAGHPDLRYEAGDDWITVHPRTARGFPITLTERGGKYTVSFGGWREYFESEKEALNCVAFGLSTACRLKVHRRGQREYEWTVEAFDDGNWVEDSTTGLFLFPFWLKDEVQFYQNDVIVVEQDAGGST